jgi:hypothetical protein
MDDRIKAIAEKMGAVVVAELPDVGHGGLGAAHYAAFYRKRMEELRRQLDAGDPQSEQLVVPLNEATIRALDAISELLWPGQRVGPGLVASGLLKRVSGLILEQLGQPLVNEGTDTHRLLDAKAAFFTALQELLDPPDQRQAAG